VDAERKAVVVERDGVHRNTIRVLLEGIGFEVCEFSTAAAAARHPFERVDLLVVDLSPGASIDDEQGRALRGMAHPARIVAMSSASGAVPSWLMEAGCSHVLTKPLDVDGFLDVASAVAGVSIRIERTCSSDSLRAGEKG